MYRVDQGLYRLRAAGQAGRRGPHAPPIFLMDQFGDERFYAFLRHIETWPSAAGAEAPGLLDTPWTPTDLRQGFVHVKSKIVVRLLRQNRQQRRDDLAPEARQ